MTLWSDEDVSTLNSLLSEADTKSLTDFSAVLNKPIRDIQILISKNSDVEEPVKSAISKLNKTLVQIPFNEMVNVLFSRANLVEKDPNYNADAMASLSKSNLSVIQYAQQVDMDWRAAIYRIAHYFNENRYLLLLSDACEEKRHFPYLQLYSEFIYRPKEEGGASFSLPISSTSPILESRLSNADSNKTLTPKGTHRSFFNLEGGRQFKEPQLGRWKENDAVLLAHYLTKGVSLFDIAKALRRSPLRIAPQIRYHLEDRSVYETIMLSPTTTPLSELIDEVARQNMATTIKDDFATYSTSP